MIQNSVHQPECIIIVDDDAAIRDLLVRGIRRSGYECYAAASAFEALDLLVEKPVDVVISDINMPEMNGLELIKIIKEKHDCDVIVMTGFIEEFTYEEIIGRGASDFVQKPVRIAEFVARLKRVLLERALRKEHNLATEELEINLDKFRRAMDGIVQAMSLAVELRDPYTAGHQQRVANLATAIATAMGLPGETIYALRMASIIHDFGKITVPAEILCKPGRLNNLEYELIKNHVMAGYNILKKIEFPWPLADIIVQHHERINGSGYPKGLHGDQIRIEARILAVSDVFETISSHRPYRPSLGQDRAIEEIDQKKGELYDTDVSDTCLTIIITNKFRFDDKRSSFSSESKNSTSISERVEVASG
ncbi:MAG: response regulator [Desulfobacteraceae bacterium]|jgi:putative nucleotidyltransferase with HDIG domain